MLEVHHLNNSRSQRVLWMLEELGTPYTIVYYQRDAKTRLAPPELKAIHPLGKSPVIRDGEQVIAESGAILEYLVEHYGKGKFVPEKNTKAFASYRYWMHYAEGSAMLPLLLSLIFSEMTKAPMPFFIRPVVKGIATKVRSMLIHPQLKSHFSFMESELRKSTWFAGEEFTAADIQMSFVIEAGEARGSVSEAHPKLRQFLTRIHARSAYARALETGGPIELMK